MCFVLSFLSDLLGHDTEVCVLPFLLPKGEPGLFLSPWHFDPVVKLGEGNSVLQNFRGSPEISCVSKI